AVTWLVPAGYKSLPKGLRYDDVIGERNLDNAAFELIREQFANLTIERWHVLTKLSVIIPQRPLLERWDWTLFKILPPVRRMGDQAVLTFEKPTTDRVSQ
ncbi:MAG: hypothetical protein KF861_17710, partial [Planctomycetaceae bacterium]|nr:hypothetical protein [Planctomycetaceae bacterium]